jgi:hypothetical protein
VPSYWQPCVCQAVSLLSPAIAGYLQYPISHARLANLPPRCPLHARTHGHTQAHTHVAVRKFSSHCLTVSKSNARSGRSPTSVQEFLASRLVPDKSRRWTHVLHRDPKFMCATHAANAADTIARPRQSPVTSDRCLRMDGGGWLRYRGARCDGQARPQARKSCARVSTVGWWW